VSDIDAIDRAIARSREHDEIVTIEVADLTAATAEVERIAAEAGEPCDIEEVTHGDGRPAVEAWGWSASRYDDSMTWRLTLVARTPNTPQN
jgi:hypothetical protein